MRAGYSLFIVVHLNLGDYLTTNPMAMGKEDQNINDTNQMYIGCHAQISSCHAEPSCCHAEPFQSIIHRLVGGKMW